MILWVIITLLVKNSIALEDAFNDEVIFDNETMYETYEGDLVVDNETMYENYGNYQLFENENDSFSDQIDIDPSTHLFAVYDESTGNWQANTFHL